MAQATITTASTFEFLLTATKNGVVWDLSGATVTIFFQQPDGINLAGKPATILVPAAGTASYVTTTTDITIPGQWYVCWQVSQAGVVINSKPIPIFVVDVPPNEGIG